MFKLLRGKLRELGMDQEYIALKIGISRSWLSFKLTGKRTWTLTEMYAIMDLINEPDAKLNEYFPRGGHDIQPMPQKREQVPAEPFEIKIYVTVEANGNVVAKL